MAEHSKACGCAGKCGHDRKPAADAGFGDVQRFFRDANGNLVKTSPNEAVPTLMRRYQQLGPNTFVLRRGAKA